MGLACPVCEDVQPDAEHLANHLAFTAVLGDDAHEAWLDEHAPDWGAGGPADLAPVVAECAVEVETDGVAAERSGGRDRGGPGRPAFEERVARRGGYGRDGRDDGLSGEAEEAIAEARKLTREMYDDGEGGDEAGDADGRDPGRRAGDESE